MNFITEIDELKRLKKPPKKLWYKGNLELLKYRKVAIVGSRKMNTYSKMLILRLAGELKKREICVVSGAALGCDIIAHEGAFPHTIAVFGNGLNEIYPRTNAKMISQIYEHALALSEYDPDVKAAGFQFLERNRIVVGLCEALVVAQADLKSGSLQSARLAREMGIPVFVFPHRMGESAGTNALLAKNQANLIHDINEFADSFAELKDFKSDEILDFIRENPNFDAAFAKFGDKIYEYEIDGKIEIMGTGIILK